MTATLSLLGKTTPRLSTPPLVTGRPGPCGCGCALTPLTSAGFEAIEFAEKVCGITPLPYQRYLLIHALELLNGRFRFRTVLVLIARQQGKSFFAKILALYFMFMRSRMTVLGAAQSLDIAREAWSGAVEIAKDTPELAPEIASVRYTNGEQCLTLDSGSRYRITAATRGAGRGLSVDLLLLDELREHRSWEPWSALSKTTTARPNSLTFCLSNAGDEGSIVLNSLRESALNGNDTSLGLFEWSAPDGCELDDPEAWCQANPALGYTVDEQAIRSSLSTDPPSVYRTEVLCQRVDVMDSAISPSAWRDCADKAADLAPYRDRITVCVDVALDGAHVTACAAAQLDDGTVRGEVIGAWKSTEDARAALPELFAKLRPRAVGYFPAGPGSVLAVDLGAMHGHTIGQLTVNRRAFLEWAPGVVELTGSTVTECCQAFADLVSNRKFRHRDDPLLNSHVNGSQRYRQGDGWRFARRGGVGHVDAVYAMAGAVHLARSLPEYKPKPKPKIY